MEREALKLALEALESIAMIGVGEGEVCEYLAKRARKALAAVDEALAQPADNPYGYDWSMLEAAQESLREHMARIKELEAQLAQPAQEPVGYVYSEAGVKHGAIQRDLPNGTPLYAAPPQRPWVGLTPEDILVLFDEHNLYGSKLVEFTRAVETKIKEKNND